jgi:hypothetical protein
MARPLSALRPEPHRGDTVAAGAVVLTTAVYLLEARFAHVWSSGVRLAVDLFVGLFVGLLAVQSPLEGERPRAYQSVLYVATFALAIVTLRNLADVLGARHSFNAAGTIVWVGLVLLALAAWLSVRRNSAIMTLLAAVSLAFVVEAFVDWVFSPSGATAFRWILVALVLGFALASLAQRGARPRHGVQLVNAAGLAAVVLGLTFALDLVFSGIGAVLGGGPERHGLGTGWELFLLACGFGLIAYSGVDRESGPAYLGVVVLALFTGLAAAPGSGGASLIGWPIVLLALAGAMLAIGLRPSRPLPPSPDAGGPPPPPPAPMRPVDPTEDHRP